MKVIARFGRYMDTATANTIEQHTTSISTMQSQLNSVENAVTAVETMNDQQNTLLSGHTTQIKDLERYLSMAQYEISELQQSFGTMKDDIQALEDEEIDPLLRRVFAIEQELDGLADSINEIVG